MGRRKSGVIAAWAALLPAAVFIVLAAMFVAPALADIYRWEDESGVIHFTDDLSNIPPKYRGKYREIQKTPPATGRPSVSTMDAPLSPTGPSVSPGPPNGNDLFPPELPQNDDAAHSEKLRAKIDAKERFIRGVDEKQSLATNPYRNRLVSPPDLELYKKYKAELPVDRERLKALESIPSPIKEP